MLGVSPSWRISSICTGPAWATATCISTVKDLSLAVHWAVTGPTRWNGPTPKTSAHRRAAPTRSSTTKPSWNSRYSPSGQACSNIGNVMLLPDPPQLGYFSPLAKAFATLLGCDDRRVSGEVTPDLGERHLLDARIGIVAREIPTHLDDSPRVVTLVEPLGYARVQPADDRAEAAVRVDVGLRVIEAGLPVDP